MIGFIDLSFVSVYTEAIKTCINSYVARIFLPGLFQYIFIAIL